MMHDSWRWGMSGRETIASARAYRTGAWTCNRTLNGWGIEAGSKNYCLSGRIHFEGGHRRDGERLESHDQR